MIISSIDLFFSRDCAGGAGPVVDAPKFAVFAVFAEVLGAAVGAVGCEAAPNVPRPVSPLSFGANPDDVACPLVAEVTVGSFAELVLGLGIGLNREIPEVPAVVVAVAPELTFLGPSVTNKFEVAGGVVAVGEVESATADTPGFNAPSDLCPREANRDGAELCVFAPVVDELRLDKDNGEGFVVSCVPALGTSLEVAVVGKPEDPLSLVLRSWNSPELV